MITRGRPHRLASLIAGALLFTIFFLVLPESACAQTRIISLSGDLDFGRVPFLASAQRTLVISNTGDSTLTISNVTFPPVPLWGQSSFQANWFGTIPPGGRQDVLVTFTPMEILGAGTNDLDFQGYLTVQSDATAGTNDAFLSGVGTWPPLAPGVNLDFGTVPIGAPNQMTLYLTNLGSVPVTLSNVFVPNGFDTAYLFGTIQPGAAKTVFVAFSPGLLTNYQGIVTINSDATDPVLVLVTPNGNVTNSALGVNLLGVSGTGTYPVGKFAGLFAPTNDPAFDNSGYITAESTATGKFHGTLTLANKRYPFSATISPSASVSATIARGRLPGLNVSLKFLGVPAGRRSWIGTVGNGTWTSRLRMVPNVRVTSSSNHVIPPGQYIINLSGSTNGLITSTNSSTGSLEIKVTDAVRVRGILSDGASYSQNTTIFGIDVPFYSALYGGRGAILGWISFAFPRTPPVTNAIPSVSLPLGIVGTLNWFKPAGIDPNYPDGFSFQTTVSGSVP